MKGSAALARRHGDDEESTSDPTSTRPESTKASTSRSRSKIDARTLAIQHVLSEVRLCGHPANPMAAGGSAAVFVRNDAVARGKTVTSMLMMRIPDLSYRI